MANIDSAFSESIRTHLPILDVVSRTLYAGLEYLQLPNGQEAYEVSVDSPDFIAWLNELPNKSFRYEYQPGTCGYTARKESVKNTHCWRAYRTIDGKGRHVCLGVSRKITMEKLKDAYIKLHLSEEDYQESRKSNKGYLKHRKNEEVKRKAKEEAAKEATRVKAKEAAEKRIEAERKEEEVTQLIENYSRGRKQLSDSSTK